MKIGLDIDNVITAFDELVLEEFFIEDKKKRNNGIVNPNGEWIKHKFDWNVEEVNEFFNHNMEEMAKRMKPKNGAKYYMDKLLDDGHELYLISHRAYPHYNNPYELTINWLKENNINYTKLVLSETTDKSKECFENSVDVMFDDVQSNCHKLKKAGIKCYLVQTIYNNSNRDGLDVVRDWRHIYDTICNLSVSKLEKFHVILDTDTDNEADDQFALSYLLKSKDRIILDAVTIAPYSNNITSAKESIEKSYNVAKEVFELCNEPSDNVIFKGYTDYIINNYVEENEAVEKIVDVSTKNEITYILAIGALTNVALAIKKYPSIINKIKVIWLGGHSLLSKDNREYNFRQDIEANRIVFYSGVDLTVIPCKNVASNLVTSIYELEHNFDITQGLGKLLYDRFYNDGIHGITQRRVIWDISVVAYGVNPYWFEIKEVKCPRIDDELKYIESEFKHKIKFVDDLNVNEIYTDLFKKLSKK